LSPFDAVFNCGTSHLTRPDPVVRLTSAVHLQNGARLPDEERRRKSPFWQVQPLVSRQQPFGSLEQAPSAEVNAATTLGRAAVSCEALAAARAHHRSAIVFVSQGVVR
jgi:hypothetical protein